MLSSEYCSSFPARGIGDVGVKKQGGRGGGEEGGSDRGEDCEGGGDRGSGGGGEAVNLREVCLFCEKERKKKYTINAPIRGSCLQARRQMGFLRDLTVSMQS